MTATKLATKQKGRNLRLVLLTVVLSMILVAIGFSIFLPKPWIVPEEAKQRKNPLPPSEANLFAAKPIYREHCANCHGDTGKGDGPDASLHEPAPTDLADATHMQKLTDGEVFYQISVGRKPMPSFKKRLTEEQRWQLVLFVRSFAAAPTPSSDKNAEQLAPNKVAAPVH
jgi:mono/diheme cytochrome c family protein